MSMYSLNQIVSQGYLDMKSTTAFIALAALVYSTSAALAQTKSLNLLPTMFVDDQEVSRFAGPCSKDPSKCKLMKGFTTKHAESMLQRDMVNEVNICLIWPELCAPGFQQKIYE